MPTPHAQTPTPNNKRGQITPLTRDPSNTPLTRGAGGVCNFPPPTKGVSPPQNQKGTALIVVMVLLTAMTFLGLGAASDSSLQMALARSSQLHHSAHTAALTELNAQIDAINSNPEGQEDPIITALLNQPIQNGTRQIQGGETTNGFTLTTLANLPANAYSINISLEQPNPNASPKSPGFTIEADAPFRFHALQFTSQAQIENTQIRSRQVQAFTYMAPN
ncbi:MAG: pilus assembly PilX N-terminal domain-containing protein [Cellvibrionales bacterium]|nr:pilus assembly PilX N-terminal domain-containing protein [Cellvibrionales bacterium]